MNPTRKPNLLAAETSPYLLQHAFNPVDWRAWSDEAFAEARERDVPIFLSIGYSTCYWCHVMERESFESDDIAAQMNRDFVCIKLDREERPEIDDLYMAATVTMTGHGGWPMSVFLEPRTLRPFWCGTYFPAEPMAGLGGRPTFPQVLESITHAWRTQRDAVGRQAEQLAAAVKEDLAAGKSGAELGPGQVAQAVQILMRIFDPVNGGFGQAPKFPQPVFLEFLLDAREVVDFDTRGAIDRAVRLTLDRMMIGGIHDQIGGGFHRYSVDAMWTVPHFEKMLYDNAQLCAVYARAAVLYRDAEYQRTARRIVDYVEREMTSPSGAFYSAQDAEVDGREGLNFLWTEEEFESVLGAEDAKFASGVYGLSTGPNFRDPHHPEEPMRSVLRLSGRRDGAAAIPGPETVAERMNRVDRALLVARAARKQPRLDDKIIASWNGMMIRALADAGRLLNDRAMLDRAVRAFDDVRRKLSRGAGVGRSWRGRAGAAEGTLEDHAHLIGAAMSLRAAAKAGLLPTDGDWHTWAANLAACADIRFGQTDGGYADSAGDRTDLFAVPRSSHDGAMPAGVSVMIHALLDLADLTDAPDWRKRALSALASISGAVAASPVGSINSTRAMIRFLKAGEERAGVIRRTEPEGQDEGPVEPVEFLPVEIYAGVDRLTVSRDAPAKTRLLVRIDPRYHTIAAQPGPDAPVGLMPFRVHAIGGGGIAIYADYPAGEPYGSESVGRVNVYRGEFEIDVVIEREGEWTGRPLIGVTYQACTQTECLPVRTVELDVAIDPA